MYPSTVSPVARPRTGKAKAKGHHQGKGKAPGPQLLSEHPVVCRVHARPTVRLRPVGGRPAQGQTDVITQNKTGRALQ